MSTRLAEPLEASPARGTPSPPVAARLSSLTQLRWVAAFLVFLAHARNLGLFGTGDLGHRYAPWAFGGGSIGVSLFFVLSGFVIAYSARPDYHPGAFWLRRFARIYPLHLVTALAALALAAAAVPGLGIPGRREAVANLLLVNSWNHDWWQAVNPVSWSLTCEVFFYATFPITYAVLRRMPRWGLEGVAGAAVLAVLALAWLADHQKLTVSLYDFPLTRLPEFLAGVATGLLVRRGQWRGPTITTAAVITVVGYFLAGEVPVSYHAAACTMIGFTLLIPAFATIDARPTTRWTTISERLGEISYAFYLIHLLVLRTILWHTGNHPATYLGWLAAALAGSVALAWLLHTSIEVPARRLLVRRTTGQSR